MLWWCTSYGILETEDQEASIIVDNVRKRTWHKTLTKSINVPSVESLHQAGRRFLFVFKSLSRVNDLKMQNLNIYQYGWEMCPQSGEPIPIWDSKQNIKNVEVLLKTTLASCACQKCMCKTKQCSCVR